jgi:hypothetical protein
MPGALVLIGRNGPRYSTGASGFRSQVSTCEAPPHRKNRIVDLAFPPVTRGVDGAAGAGRPNRRPAMPTPDATRNVRRETANEVTATSSEGGMGSAYHAGAPHSSVDQATRQHFGAGRGASGCPSAGTNGPNPHA